MILHQVKLWNILFATFLKRWMGFRWLAIRQLPFTWMSCSLFIRFMPGLNCLSPQATEFYLADFFKGSLRSQGGKMTTAALDTQSIPLPLDDCVQHFLQHENTNLWTLYRNTTQGGTCLCLKSQENCNSLKTDQYFFILLLRSNTRWKAAGPSFLFDDRIRQCSGVSNRPRPS